MDALVPLDVVATEAEGEILCGLLRSAGIDCTLRVTDRGAGAGDGLSVGAAQTILVRSEDLAPAREVLRASG